MGNEVNTPESPAEPATPEGKPEPPVEETVHEETTTDRHIQTGDGASANEG